MSRIVALGVVLLLIALTIVAVVWHTHPFPHERLADLPESSRVTDRSGRVLLQTVGKDDQWRFPIALDQMSPWIVLATIAAEDSRFYEHSGVDPVAVVRASFQNLTANEVISGASTLSMQLCRMLDAQPRTVSAKVIEPTRALQVERKYSKSEILTQYLNMAPYGGNLRGIEAAAWWYFGKRAADLSLNEASLLAGLPQSPTRLRPDRFPGRARKRQAYILRRMVEARVITERQKTQVLTEPLGIVGHQSPSIASHVAWLAVSRRASGGRTTIDLDLQRDIERQVAEYSQRLPDRADVAVVVINIGSSEIVALVGSSDQHDPVDGQINGVLARRSPGSVLKPFIYGTAMEARRLNAESEIHDQPIDRAGWRPNNFDRSFQGTMTIAQALRRSRNVPAIMVLEAVGVSRCVGVLESTGIRLSDSSVAEGGLSIAVGTAETTLLDVTNAYATLGREGVRSTPRLFFDAPVQQTQAMSEAVCRTLTDILSTRHRTPRGLESIPTAELPWFMWKTGTSSGRRDAWAVGHNGRFAIGVWAGRFSGVGHADFVGREAAEPLLARLFQMPQLSTDHMPQAPAPLQIRRPLNWNDLHASGPEISSPVANAAYAGLNGWAIIPVRAKQTEDTVWFLNGRLFATSRPDHLELAPGLYELRCVSSDGQFARVEFVVESAPAAIPRLNRQ